MYKYSSAIEDDIKDIEKINKSSMAQVYDVDTFKQLVKNSIVAKLNGVVVGYAIMATLQADKEYLLPYSYKFKNTQVYSNLFSIAVDKDHRNKGIATTLMKLLLRANERHAVLLYCNKDNQIARKLYEKYKFKLVVELPKYYEKNNVKNEPMSDEESSSAISNDVSNDLSDAILLVRIKKKK